MLITNIQEFRLLFPAHAIDSIDPFLGVLDNSEHDFLMEKLGTPLYNALCDWYDKNYPDGIETQKTSYFNRLLLLSQRAVAYDAMSRAIGQHIISINNAGVNIPTADDYGKVDLEAVKTFKQSCVKEAHAAINRLLQTLEEWCKQFSVFSGSTAASSSSSSDSSDYPDDSDPSDSSELETIVTLWRKSRFYYLAATLLIPSATVLQAYWNIYDSREKFIQMLPDLRYIQEEIIAPAIGEEFCEAMVDFGFALTDEPTRPNVITRTIHKLRKVMSVMTEHRTLVINTDKLRRQTAHDEAVRLLQSAIEYIQNHHEDFAADEAIYAALQKSPIYIAPEPTAPASRKSSKTTTVVRQCSSRPPLISRPVCRCITAATKSCLSKPSISTSPCPAPGTNAPRSSWRPSPPAS